MKGLLGVVLVSSLASSGPAGAAALFPQLASRYPVGDPATGNPLDRNREGPKCIAAGDMNGDRLADLVAGNLDGSVSVLLSDGEKGMRPQLFFRAGGSIRAVAVADLDRDGNLDVVAADITGGAAVLLGNGDGTLRPPIAIALGPARAVAVGDVNRDGIPDILVAGSPADCEDGFPGRGVRFIAVLLGIGDGTFGPPSYLARNQTACIYDVALADLDGDGNLDALVLDYARREVLVFAGIGDGTFADIAPTPRLTATGGGPRAFTVAYLDERLVDGIPPPGAALDVVVADRTDARLDVYLGRGGFTFSGVITVRAGEAPRSVAAGDLNGDGIADLVVVNRNANTISVLRGLGEGRFAEPLEIAAGTSPRDIVLADLTGDGALDAGVANRISGDISAFTGRRGFAGFLVPESYYPAGITPVGIAAVDFDGDGRPDAATVNLRSGDVRVRLNRGDGTLGDEAVYAVNRSPTCMVACDLDRDGRADLAVACMGSTRYTSDEDRGSVMALLGAGDGTLRAISSTSGDDVSYQPYWIRIADLSGDGVPDAVVGGRAGELVVLEGRGDGRFGSPIVLRDLPGTSPLTMALGDLDRDGAIDIATSPGEVLINDGRFFAPSPWTGPTRNFPVGDGDWVLEPADLDGDGRLDLIVALTFVNPDPVAVHFGAGDGTFLEPTIYDAGMGVVSLAAADMDGDGTLDIVTGNRCTADVTILRGLGGRRFERSETVMTYNVEGIAVADMNGDGRLDLIGAGLALWVVLQGSEVRLDGPRAANIAGILPREGLYLNEVMAANKSYYTDDAGKTPDWVEIFNEGADGKDLTGWSLRNRGRDGLDRDWTFPGGTTIGPMGYLVVSCDGGGRPGLHASFSLDDKGETLVLIDPKKTVVDQVSYPDLPEDVSYARFADGARYLCYNSVPTMGRANVPPTNMAPSVKLRNPYRAADRRLGVAVKTFDDLGIAYAAVQYRLEGESSYSEVPLVDDGSLRDTKPGDGTYTGLLPALPAGSRLECWFRAVDLDGEVTTFPADPTVAADLVRLVVPGPASGPRITEVLANHVEGGEDWVEIANCGDAPLGLGGLSLTNDYFDAGKAWRFPADAALGPGERIVVACDNGNPIPGSIARLHATIRLDKAGEEILLVDEATDRQILDSISFGHLPPGASFGLAGCSGEPTLLASPTPGRPNSGRAVPFLRGDPSADGAVDITDAIVILVYLFQGVAVSCPDAADVDDSGAVDITDVVAVLTYLFLAGDPPPEPFAEPGLDPTPDALTCE